MFLGHLEDGATGAEKRSKGPIGGPGAFAEPGTVIFWIECTRSHVRFIVISIRLRVRASSVRKTCYSTLLLNAS